MTADIRNRVEETVDTIRTEPRLQLSVIVVGLIVALLLALFHWVGFLVAGMVLGVASTSVKQALVGVLGVWVIVISIFLGYAWWHDKLAIVLDLGELTLVSMVIPLGLVFIGSLLRGIV